jgi:hypothetical protein
MQAPHKPATTQPTADDIVFCPKCNMNLFAPLSVYAITKNDLIGEQQLSQSLTAIQCCECRTVLPLSQLNEFTKAQLEKSATTAPQELLEDDKKEESEIQW